VVFAVLIHWILQHRETEVVGLLINQLHQLQLFKITSGHLQKFPKKCQSHERHIQIVIAFISTVTFSLIRSSMSWFLLISYRSTPGVW